MNRHFIRVTAIGATQVAMVACSSNSSNPPVDSRDAAIVDATAGSLDAPSSIIVPLSGDGAGATGTPIMCGNTTCNPPSGGMFPLSACCLPDNGCGATFGAGLGGVAGGASTCLDVRAGTSDPSCPSQSMMGFSLPACCSVEGICGVDLSMAGLGCNSLSGLSFGMIEASAPQPCGDSAAASPGPDATADTGSTGGDSGTLVDAGLDAIGE